MNPDKYVVHIEELAKEYHRLFHCIKGPEAVSQANHIRIRMIEFIDLDKDLYRGSTNSYIKGIVKMLDDIEKWSKK